MDVMTRRRAMVARKAELDTSPKIKLWGYSELGGDPSTKGYRTAPASCITEIYTYASSPKLQTIVHYGAYYASVIYKNNNYVDWWGTQSQNSIVERAILNANSNGIEMSLTISMLDDCFAYIKDTGQILFAGKNSIYYGHRNVSEIT